MFICQGACGQSSKPGEPLLLKIVEKREKAYTNADGAVIGQGWETARVERRCPRCK